MSANEQPSFMVNEYDSDGDVVTEGISLCFGINTVHVADSKEGFADFIKHLQTIEKELLDNY